MNEKDAVRGLVYLMQYINDQYLIMYVKVVVPIARPAKVHLRTGNTFVPFRLRYRRTGGTLGNLRLIQH